LDHGMEYLGPGTVAVRAAIRAADSAVQIHGGLGYMDDCPVSRYYRDVRWVNIGDGTRGFRSLLV
jgi:alkylation response protein AidB-like acyl-CoA dehydrogenase